MTSISLKGKTREEWLALRKNGIGGSEAAAVLGLHPYMTPYSVWADKKNLLPEKEDTEAMRQGRDLEDYVARRFMEKTGKRVKRTSMMLWHSEIPFLFADVDRMVVGERAGLECKTTSTLNLKQFQNGEYPDTYYCQCMHYMAVTGFEKWYLAVLVLGKEFLVYEIPRNEEEIEALIEAEKAFWEKVQGDTPPEVDGKTATTEAIHTIYREVEPGKMTLFGEEGKVRDLLALDTRIKALKKEKERLEQHFKEALGAFEYGEAGAYTVSWKNAEKNSFQMEAFRRDHPEIELTPYFKKTAYRRFQVKER